jgi:hypothetical protein
LLAVLIHGLGGRTLPHWGAMAETYALRKHDAAIDGWAVLHPFSEPALVGDGQDGIDWTCPQCGTVLVRAAVSDRQVLDLLIRCYACEQVSGSPLRQPGQPLAEPRIIKPPGEYMFDSAVQMGSVATIGQQALAGYLREIGQPAAGPREPGDATCGHGLTPTGLRTMASKAAELLGDRYADLLAVDEKGRKSETSPLRRHRLIELITYAREAADEMDAKDEQPMNLDADSMSELSQTITLFDSWRHHPVWPELVSTLADETEGHHTVMLLGVATYLADAGNGIGLVTHSDGDGARIPDLWSEPLLLERLEVEVKTPQELRGPRASPLTLDDAKAIISRQLKKAASSKSGQLDATQTGILAIGGFHLGTGSLEKLEAAAKAVLAGQAGRKMHLAAVMVSELTYSLTNIVDEQGNQVESNFQPLIETQLIRHPSYHGGLEIRDESAPWAKPHVQYESAAPDPKRPEHRGPKARRNDPCPCGSGVKFKRCCGA